jgi:uncharacterized membrane protein
MLVFGWARLQEFPAQMAIHFDLNGQPDAWGGKAFAIGFLPSLTFALLWLIPALIRISPTGFKLENSHRILSKINLAVALLMNGLQFGILMTNLHPEKYRIASVISVSFAAFLIGLGNFMSKTERNFFIGIRTPWTIASEKTWLATHRFAAKLMVGTGLVLLVSAGFTANIPFATGALLFAVLTPVLYSYWHFRGHDSTRTQRKSAP